MSSSFVFLILLDSVTIQGSYLPICLCALVMFYLLVSHIYLAVYCLCRRYVGNFVRRTDRILPNPDAKYTNLYMKNLDPDVREELLQEKFSEFGKIVSLAISRDENGSSRGFGFVNFDNPDDARRALETMNGSQLGSLHIILLP